MRKIIEIDWDTTNPNRILKLMKNIWKLKNRFSYKKIKKYSVKSRKFTKYSNYV